MGVFLQNTFAVAANDDVCPRSMQQQCSMQRHHMPVESTLGLGSGMPRTRIMMNAKDRALQTHKQKMHLGLHHLL